MSACRKIQQKLLKQWSNNDHLPGERVWGSDLTNHLTECEICRSFRDNLKITGKRLDDIDVGTMSEIIAPNLSYFENLIDVTVKATTRPGCFWIGEVSVFIVMGLFILAGLSLAVWKGYFVFVGAIYGAIAIFAPFMILLRQEPETGMGG